MNTLAKIAVRHWKLLLPWNVFLLLLTVANINFTPKVWTSKAELILPNVTSNSNAEWGKLGSVKDSGVVFSQQLNPLKILSSIAISDEVLSKVWSADPERGSYKFKSYKGLFKVSQETESTIMSLQVEGSTPELARQRGQALIARFRERLQELRKDEAMQRSQFVQTEVKSAHDKLLKAQIDLASLKESASLVNSDDQTKQLIATINSLDALRSQAYSDARANAQQAKMLSNSLNLDPDVALQSMRLGEDKEYQFIRQKLSEVQAALTEAQSQFTNNHPRVRKLLIEQQVLRQLLHQPIVDATGKLGGVDTKVGENTAILIRQLIVAQSEAAAMQQKAQQLQNQIDKLRATLKSLPAQQARLQEVQRRYEIADGVYNGLVGQVEQAKLGAFSAYPSVQILDQPLIDSKPSSPRVSLILIGAMLACGFSSAAIVLLMESRNPLLSPKDIHQTKIPILASISHIKGLAQKIDQKVGSLIEFQRLASAVSLIRLEKGRLMIVSASSGEGKTTTTLGLANALINLGFRVLVVDGDFRKAQLSQYLGYQPTFNSQFIPVNVRPNLDLLTPLVEVGKIAEFVARGGFEECLSLAQADGHYDYVLVDSAPVNLTSETPLMATVVTNVLMVTKPGQSDRNPFNKSVDLLTRHRAAIVGLVVNGIKTQTQDYLYHPNKAEIT